MSERDRETLWPDRLLAECERAVPRTLTAWHQNAGGDAIDLVRSGVPGHSGRYHRAGGTRTWYGSSSEDAAWAEFFRHYAEKDIDPSEVIRRVGTISFEGLVALDLTDAEIRDALGLTEEELSADDYAVCQRLADRAREAGFEAILAPSAGLPDATTLAIFGDAVFHRRTTVDDRGRRQPPIRMRQRLAVVRKAADDPE